MKENLAVTRFRNGAQIPDITNSYTWIDLTIGAARCWYNNDSATNSAIYGSLYNWKAVNSTNGLCPAGWHVPSSAEWNELVTFLGGTSLAGGRIKETGLSHWNSPNTGATNSSGFTALGAGNRSSNVGDYNFKGTNAYFWTSSSYTSSLSNFRSLNNTTGNIYSNNGSNNLGLSVRCIRD